MFTLCKKNLPVWGIYLYIALPFLIFAAGFLKWYFAVPFTILTLVSLYFAAGDSWGLTPPPSTEKAALKALLAVLFIFAMVLLSGIGNIFWQNNDHATRNTIFDILVRFDWPPKEVPKDTEVGLVYYIGFWLPSALAGKLAGLDIGYIFTLLWTVAGLFIVWYLLCVFHKKFVVYPIIIFMFFGGMDVFGYKIAQSFFEPLSKTQLGKWTFPSGSSFSYHIEWWAKYFQYSSHTTQLFWVFNQCIPAWIATLVIILEKNNKNFVFIMGLTLLSSTLPFVGLIPIFIWCVLCDHDSSVLDRPFTHNPASSFLSLFTFQNIVGGGISGIISFLYLKGNIASSSSNAAAAASSKGGISVPVLILCIAIWSAFTFQCLISNSKVSLSRIVYPLFALPLCFMISNLPQIKLTYYILFILLEFLILSFIIYPCFGKSTLFILSVICLMYIPFFKVGKSIDFCMRASIPLLVLMCLFSMSALDKYFKQNRFLLAVILCTILLLGAVTPLREITRTIEATAYEIEKKGHVENDSKTIAQVFKGKNFTGKTEDNLFFEFFAK